MEIQVTTRVWQIKYALSYRGTMQILIPRVGISSLFSIETSRQLADDDFHVTIWKGGAVFLDEVDEEALLKSGKLAGPQRVVFKLAAGLMNMALGDLEQQYERDRAKCSLEVIFPNLAGRLSGKFHYSTEVGFQGVVSGSVSANLREACKPQSVG